MRNINELRAEMESGMYDSRLKDIYVDEKMVPYNRERYVKAIDRFKELYREEEVEIYSAPGRSEVCGNHTDHQNGHVLATSVNLDAIAIVTGTDDMTIHLVSDDMPEEIIDISDVERNADEEGTTKALIKGVVAGIEDYGYKIGGFKAYITSDVLMGAGMSSSAAFESLIGTILSGLYNHMKISSVDIAKIGQYAENVFFGKPCGLMDQMACAVGGLIYIDFLDKANPVIKQVPCDFEANQYSLCIVDTKGSHADLTDDYAAIPEEMRQVAKFFGKELLTEIMPSEFFSNIALLRGHISDRAVLRAMHFYTEQARVDEGVKALEANDFGRFLDVIRRSGDSSSKLLQNIYSTKDVHTQNVMVALGASEYFLGDEGVCRVHGGGFAGTIQAFVKNAAVDGYKNSIESIFGEGTCHVLKVRPYGGIKVIA
ncbi:MAG: galactokinase [Coprococcus sp.]|nr:galactokinase [Coprococcus sp.]